MNEPRNERPCIPVYLGPGVDPDLFRWVVVGAEEEGVPCCCIENSTVDVIELAYAAAQSSRLQVGVGVGGQAIALHEQHMPAAQPVLIFILSSNPAKACRWMGANAARMVVNRPLLLEGDLPAPTETKMIKSQDAQSFSAELDSGALISLVKMIILKVQERGLL